jgi:hypothetical protein
MAKHGTITFGTGRQITTVEVSAGHHVVVPSPEKGKIVDFSVCVGCGCDDFHACQPEGCSWLRVDRKVKIGVCSSCEHLVSVWDRGERLAQRFDKVGRESEENK